ncbi:hypothetical protein VCHA49P379_230003 [Vibrio chagasii]|nr:hypothetical protein VCHA49P379_230003 [Vibrio chagasii]
MVSVVVLAFGFNEILNAEFLNQLLAWIFLICLLPPTASIIVIETSYLGIGTTAARTYIETISGIVMIGVYSTVRELVNL